MCVENFFFCTYFVVSSSTQFSCIHFEKLETCQCIHNSIEKYLNDHSRQL